MTDKNINTLIEELDRYIPEETYHYANGYHDKNQINNRAYNYKIHVVLGRLKEIFKEFNKKLDEIKKND